MMVGGTTTGTLLTTKRRTGIDIMKRVVVFFIVFLLTSTIFTFAAITTTGSVEELAPEEVESLGTRVDPGWNLNFDGEIDLREDSQVTLIGKNGGSPNGDYAGWAVATGDINNDGWEELFIGAPKCDVNQSAIPPADGPGEMYVYFGRNRTDFNGSIDFLECPPDITFRGWEPAWLLEGQLGHAIEIADINNDNYGDIIVSERNMDNQMPPWTNGHAGGMGIIYIMYGKEKHLFKSHYDIYKECDAMINNGSLRGFMGESLATGDLDDDGFDDIVYGASNGDLIGVKFGGVGLTGQIIPECYFFTNQQKCGIGKAVSVGDINNDGYDDIMIGCPQYDSYGGALEDVGRVFIYLGRPRGDWFSGQDIEDVANLTIYGKDLRDSFGQDMVIGDVNGDDFGDIFVTAPNGDGWGNKINGSGEGYLIMGNDHISYGLGKWGNPQIRGTAVLRPSGRRPQREKGPVRRDLSHFWTERELSQGYELIRQGCRPHHLRGRPHGHGGLGHHLRRHGRRRFHRSYHILQLC